MNTETEFLQAICTDPADDTARLVFADWLEETGTDPGWADFIRAQVELARHGKGGWLHQRRIHALKLRELVFVRDMRPRTRPGVGCHGLTPGLLRHRMSDDTGTVAWFHRGLPAAVTCSAGYWDEEGDTIAWAPGMPCHGCQGSGEVASYYPDGRLQLLGDCPDCGRSGKEPYDGQSPITEVRLTDVPDWGAWFWGWGSEFWPAIDSPDTFTTARFPGVTFLVTGGSGPPAPTAPAAAPPTSGGGSPGTAGPI